MIFAACRDPYLSTVGVQIERHSTGGLLSSGVTLQLVDFAGQPEYYVPHSLFLRQSSAVYVVVVPYCVPTVSVDPKASHTPLNQHHLVTASSTPPSSPLSSFGGYVPNFSYRDELEYQLKSLCTTLPASAHVPAIVAITHIDVINNHGTGIGNDTGNAHWMKPDLAILSKMKNDLNDVFSPALEIVDVIAVDYSRDGADGSVSSLGKRIISSATVIHERSFIPKHYQAAMRCIDSLAVSSPSSVLPVSQLSDHVSVALQEFGEKQGSKFFASKSTKLLAATAKISAENQASVDALLRFLGGMGLILLDSRLDVCVLHPHDWLARILAMFVAQNRASGSLMAHRHGLMLSKDIVCRQSELECRSEQEVAVVMQLLVQLELCHPLHDGLASSDSSSSSGLAQSYLFPGLLPSSMGRFVELDILLNSTASQSLAPASAPLPSSSLSSSSVELMLACSVECATANTIISPALFPVLQQRLLRACRSLDACVLRRGVVHLLPEHNGHRFRALLLLHESQRAIWALLLCPSGDSAVMSSGVEVLDGLLRLLSQVCESYTCEVQHRQLCSHCVLHGDPSSPHHVMASDPAKMHGRLLQPVLAASLLTDNHAAGTQANEEASSDSNHDAEEKVPSPAASGSNENKNRKVISILPAESVPLFCNEHHLALHLAPATSASDVHQRLRVVEEKAQVLSVKVQAVEQQAVSAHTVATATQAHTESQVHSLRVHVQVVEERVVASVDEQYDRLTRKLERTTTLPQLEAVIAAVRSQ